MFRKECRKHTWVGAPYMHPPSLPVLFSHLLVGFNRTICLYTICGNVLWLRVHFCDVFSRRRECIISWMNITRLSNFSTMILILVMYSTSPLSSVGCKLMPDLLYVNLQSIIMLPPPLLGEHITYALLVWLSVSHNEIHWNLAHIQDVWISVHVTKLSLSSKVWLSYHISWPLGG